MKRAVDSASDPASSSHPPKPRDAELDVFGCTHIGKVRSSNEDHFLVASLHKTMRVRATSLPNPELLEMPSERLALLMLVADGVGGARAGGEASRAAAESAAMFVTETMQCYYRSDPSNERAFIEALQAAAASTQKTVLERAAANPDLRGMATTLTLGLGVWPRLYLLQIGDSRAYQLLDGTLMRLTRDQTVAQDLVDTGVLKQDDAAHSPLSHVLSSAIGADSHPVVTSVRLNPRVTTFLCTDGLTKHLSEEHIRARLMSERSAEKACRTLVDDALEAGGSDNITVVCVRVRATKEA